MFLQGSLLTFVVYYCFLGSLLCIHDHPWNYKSESVSLEISIAVSQIGEVFYMNPLKTAKNLLSHLPVTELFSFIHSVGERPFFSLNNLVKYLGLLKPTW